jgi:hypothetical protein
LQPVDLAAGILQSGLTLIGEIQISRTGKDQVVGAFEVLDLTSVHNAPNGSTVWVEQQDALLVIGDKDTAVAMDLGFRIFLMESIKTVSAAWTPTIGCVSSKR